MSTGRGIDPFLKADHPTRAPEASRVKVIQQTARLLGLLVNSIPMLSGALYSSTLPPEASPIH
jgi:hypothetical protein